MLHQKGRAKIQRQKRQKWKLISSCKYHISSNKLSCLNPLTPKISLVILLTVCHMILIMLVWRIWYWIN